MDINNLYFGICKWPPLSLSKNIAIYYPDPLKNSEDKLRNTEIERKKNRKILSYFEKDA